MYPQQTTIDSGAKINISDKKKMTTVWPFDIWHPRCLLHNSMWNQFTMVHCSGHNSQPLSAAVKQLNKPSWECTHT